ncbi:hypothetical protein LTS10_013075 [Elasticomyces elasticus]|nr:hypothetical protein LTS10_013075 [Elasticomyces elasticus]
MFSKAILPALAGTLFALLALATPFDGLTLSRRDVYVPETCTPLVYGAKTVAFGSVCATVENSDLKVVYTTNAGWTTNEVHVIVGTSKPTETAPGQFPYASGNGFCSTSGTIATHIAATSSTGASETGWGSGDCYDTKGNCAKFWTFHQQCRCPVVYNYEDTTTTTTIYRTTIITEKATYTVTFAPETKTETCANPSKGYTGQVTTTKAIPADWTPPAASK